MKPLLYDELASWYRLVDPVKDHLDEAECYQAAFERATLTPPETLLELGAGAGNNAFFLKRRFRCTLTDPSERMRTLSREQNPECEHLAGDMRSLRLDRTFDVVLVHDAVVYMTTEEDLAAAARTAFVHTVPGGVAIVAPDALRETFHETAEVIEGNEGVRSLKCLAWTWDPDPGDTTYTVDYAFLLRDGEGMDAVHDRHVEGLFSTDTWRRILRAAGFDVEIMRRPIGDEEADDIFLCHRRG